MEPNDRLEEAVLDRLAAGWIALGAPLGGLADRTLVDPEALIVMTALRGRDEARVHETALDWCIKYGRFVNGSRLRTVAREIGGDAAELVEFAARVAGGGGPRWPMFAGQSVPYRSRGKIVVDHLREPGALAVRLRALFGVAARADVLAVLACAPDVALSLAELAARTRSTKRNVAIAVDSLRLGGAVDVDNLDNAQRVRLAADPGFRSWLGETPEAADWATRWSVVEAVLAFDGAPIRSPVARAVEARAVADRLVPLARRSGLPLPDTRVRGEAFWDAFERWSDDLTSAIRPATL